MYYINPFCNLFTFVIVNNPTLKYDGQSVNVSLLSNPSHLEAINPVAMGKARAKQTELMKSADPDCNLGDRVMCVQIHGDAVSVSGYVIFMISFILTKERRHSLVKVLSWNH